MVVNKALATALGDAVGEFVNNWIIDNHGGPVPANEVLSMLATHAGRLIQLAPDPEHRVHLVGEFVAALVENSEAPAMVSVMFAPQLVSDKSLAAAKPAGTA